jgi:SAM-dependent methyltransferase
VAWAYGGPTVSVRDGETGMLAAPYDIEDFAAKIFHLLEDTKCNRTLGGNAMRDVRERFSWERHVETVERSLMDACEVAAVGVAPLPRERRRTVRRRYTAVWEKRRLIASLPDGRLALDVGAGGGEYVPDLLLRARRVIAVDNDPARVQGLRHRFAHVANVSIVQASIDALPFRARAFDIVWASEVLEHLSTLDTLGELERTSARDIVATMPSPLGPYRYLDPSHVLRYSIGSVRRAVGARPGWSYSLEGLGLCLPQWIGLDAFRERWLAFSRGRPWAAWTLLIRGRRDSAFGDIVTAQQSGARDE